MPEDRGLIHVLVQHGFLKHTAGIVRMRLRECQQRGLDRLCNACRLWQGHRLLATQSRRKPATGSGAFIRGRGRPQGQWTSRGSVSVTRTSGIPGAPLAFVRVSRLAGLARETFWHGAEPLLRQALEWKRRVLRLPPSSAS